jgi:hypothetical protein
MKRKRQRNKIEEKGKRMGTADGERKERKRENGAQALL